MENEIPSREEMQKMLHENVCDIEFVSGDEVVETRATLLNGICGNSKGEQSIDESLVCFWGMDVDKDDKWQKIKHSDIRQFHERLKPCTWCKKNKPLSAFARTNRRRATGGYRWKDKCLECVENSKKEIKNLKSQHQQRQKFCSRCGWHKPRTNNHFHQKRGEHETRNGFDTECIVCAKNRDTNWWGKDNKKVQEKMRLELGQSNDSKKLLDEQFLELFFDGNQNYEVFDEYGESRGQRKKREVSVWTRSPQFRRKVMEEFNNKCCITSVYGNEINEACHIEPHCENQNNDISNGLYMSRNCHALFDANLLIIDGECILYIHPDYRNEREFKGLFGRKLKLPESVCRRLLQARYDESLPNYKKQVEDWKRQNPEKVLPENEPYDQNLKSF